MGTKANPGKFDCYAAAGDDEPIFILRATDKAAPDLIRAWALRRTQRRKTIDAKVMEALDCADAMEAWREANVSPVVRE